MSVTSCVQFLEEVQDSAVLKQQLKAITGLPEMIALGRRAGYTFDADELAAASSSFRPQSSTPETGAPSASVGHQQTAFHHYEFALDAIPGLAEVVNQLPSLKVRPQTVDLAAFDATFRADDLESLNHAPNTPEFARTYGELLKPAPATETGRRDFHLINLDEQVDDPGYPTYFEAKSRVVTALEGFFGEEVRFSGSLWYPPGSYRLWHTNEAQPGWRMYVVDLDSEPLDVEHSSFFRYQKPGSDELVTLPERRRIVRFFKVEQDPERLFWHCIANPGPQHRWSFGFAVSDGWMDAFGPDLLALNSAQEG